MHRNNILLGALIIAIFLSGIFVTPNELSAQRRHGRKGGYRSGSPGNIGLGIRTGYDYNADAWSLGGQIILPLGGRRGGIQIIPSGDIFFITDNNHDWQLNLDAALKLPLFHIGAGIAYLNRDFSGNNEDDTKSGTNLFIGISPPGRRLPVFPFAEARWTFVEDERLFRIAVGINIILGK